MHVDWYKYFKMHLIVNLSRMIFVVFMIPVALAWYVMVHDFLNAKEIKPHQINMFYWAAI